MSNSQQLGSSFIDGLRAPHYIDGRLLTADDLDADQKATLARMDWLGRAAGHGVVEGLTVSGQGDELRVEPGLGLTRSGHSFQLPIAVSLPLRQIAVPAAGLDAGRFQNCRLEETVAAGALSGGFYLLAATPASRLEGTAPLRGSPGGAGAPACAARWEVEGLQFKAVRLTGFSPPSGETPDAAARLRLSSRARSELAHWCYGSERLRGLPLDPFGFGEAYTGLDDIATADLSGCDLPLAVFHWTGTALGFVDMWPARRSLVRPGAFTSFQATLAERRVAEGQARFLQFQDQLDWLAARTAPANVSAADYFSWLPPVGLVPLSESSGAAGFFLQALTRLAINSELQAVRARIESLKGDDSIPQALAGRLAASGYDAEAFFKELTIEQVGLIAGDEVDSLINRSWHDEALQLSEKPPVEIYLVVEVLTNLLADMLYDLAGDDARAKTLLSALQQSARQQVQAQGKRPSAELIALARSLARAQRQRGQEAAAAVSTRARVLKHTSGPVNAARSFGAGASAAQASNVQLYVIFVGYKPSFGDRRFQEPTPIYNMRGSS